MCSTKLVDEKKYSGGKEEFIAKIFIINNNL